MINLARLDFILLPPIRSSLIGPDSDRIDRKPTKTKLTAAVISTKHHNRAVNL